jgi:hypothetical protein
LRGLDFSVGEAPQRMCILSAAVAGVKAQSPGTALNVPKMAENRPDPTS